MEKELKKEVIGTKFDFSEKLSKKVQKQNELIKTLKATNAKHHFIVKLICSAIETDEYIRVSCRNCFKSEPKIPFIGVDGRSGDYDYRNIPRMNDNIEKIVVDCNEKIQQAIKMLSSFGGSTGYVPTDWICKQYEAKAKTVVRDILRYIVYHTISDYVYSIR